MLQPRRLYECDENETESVLTTPGGSRDRPRCGEKKLLLAPKIRLSSGQEMPVIGFGTYKLKGFECSTAVHTAIEAGFRHFDTAFYYENEREVGEAIRTQISLGNVDRENIFLTTKLWNIHHEPKEVRRICIKQLNSLGLSYIDLYLLHFPVAYALQCDEILKPQINNKLALTNVDYVDTWRAMEDLVREGLVRSIGVCNFNMDQIQRIIANCLIKPMVNQIEIWPGFMQNDLCDYCKYNGIVIEAYSPLGRPNREERKPIYFFSVKLREIANRYNKKPAQIVWRYLIDSGIVPIVKTSNPIYIQQNIEIFDFELSDEDMAALRRIKPKQRINVFPEVQELKHPFYPFESNDEN